jgi:hypothetical protein
MIMVPMVCHGYKVVAGTLRPTVRCDMPNVTGSKDIRMFRIFALLSFVALVAGCTNPNDLDEAPVEMGNFSLGHNVVVASKMTRGPLSREASEDEWKEALTTAIGDRFGRYEGDRLYHFGVSVEGYVLAQPGIPVVASPKSVLIVLLTVWDDAAGEKMNTPPEQITIVESISGNTVFGSGLTQSKEVQMQNLSRNASKQIENFLVRRRKADGWFGPALAVAPTTETGAETRTVEAVAGQNAAAPAQALRTIVPPPAGAAMQEPKVELLPEE